jgi:hypothetical protein
MSHRNATVDRHRWAFFRASGFDQIKLRDGADIAALEHLDQKLWTALACPATGLEFPEQTLKFIDTDNDGRIRAPELIATIKWVSARLKSLDVLAESGDALPLDVIDAGTAEGATTLSSARQILANLGKPDARSISAGDTGDMAKIFADTTFNGDGVIPAEATEDPELAALIGEILACSEPATDRSGKPGVTAAIVGAFYEAAQAHVDWWQVAESDPAVRVLGEATAAAAAAVAAVRTKVDDFFARCRLAAFDDRAIQALNREESAYLELAAKDLSITPDEVSDLPLARVAADRALPLTSGVNPAWQAALGTLASAAVAPLLGEKAELTEADWRELTGKLAPFEAWTGSKSGQAVESLGIPRLQEILAGDGKAAIEALIAQDEDLADEAQGIDDVNKLLHLRRDLFTLLNNFVSFRDFYTPGKDAIFQAGTLYLDERSCDLCVKVADMGAHGIMAPLSRAYVAYCKCERKVTGETMTIAAAFTGGDTDFLMVGRNGIFYDRKGNDWDATIVKIVDAPLSIPQAFWAPYKRLLRWVEDTVAKRAAAADKAADAKLVAGAQEAEASAKAGEAPPAAGKSKIDVGVVAAIGVAVGGAVAALGAILQAFFGLGVWMPLGLVGLMLLISGPSMLVAWLKLRQRNLGPILNANGWAVNAQARINIPFGASLTGVAHIPTNAERDLRDPYAVDNTKRNIWVLVALLALLGGLWMFGTLDPVLPEVMDRATILGPVEEAAPAAPATEG